MNRHQAQTELRERYVRNMRDLLAGNVPPDVWLGRSNALTEDIFITARRLGLTISETVDFSRAVRERVEAGV